MKKNRLTKNSQKYAIILTMGKTKRKNTYRGYGKGHEYGWGRPEEIHKPKQKKLSSKGNRKQRERRAISEGW